MESSAVSTVAAVANKRLKICNIASLNFIVPPHFEEIMLPGIFQFLDVVSLIQKKPVCKQWKQLCIQAIDKKCDDKKSFQSNQELRDAVGKYCGPYKWIRNTEKWVNIPCTSLDAEEIASTFGYPIGKWDVSNIQNFSCVFSPKRFFNEPVGSWDVSNATNMHCMFSFAQSFDQDISSWNVSNVTDMGGMFYYATRFNQNISSWTVLNVTNTSKMFRSCTCFDQDLSTWSVLNVSNFNGMFVNCKVDAEQLSWFTEEMMHFNYYNISRRC